MAANPDLLDLDLAAKVHEDMVLMVDQEKKLRKALLDKVSAKADLPCVYLIYYVTCIFSLSSFTPLDKYENCIKNSDF